MVCFMGFQELSPSVMQNVLQKTTSPTFSLFTMMFMIIFQQWECGSHQHNTNIGGNGEEKEDVYIRDYRILAVTAKDKELMRKGQSGSESTACVYHHHHPPPDGATARGAPWPPLQYAPRSLGSLLYLSIRLSPSFSGPWTRHPAISFLVFLFVLLHTASRTASFLGLQCLAFFLYAQAILFFGI